MKDLISIIVPVYNVEEYIDDCIKSVLSQGYSMWELLLIDDGSTDESGKICDHYASIDSRIKAYHKENGGQSSARNMGLDKMYGNYVIFLDSDDYWNNNILETLVNATLKYSAEITCVANQIYDDNTKRIIGTAYENQKEVVLTGEDAFKQMLVRDGLDSNAWGKLYKSSLWRTVRFPEGHVFEDIPITYKMLLGSRRVVLTGKAYCVYRVRSTSTTGMHFSEKRMDYTTLSKQGFEYVENNYPQYKKNACIFYLNSVVENYLRLGRTEDKSRRFSDYNKFLQKEIIHYFKYFVMTDYFSHETKIAVVLNILGIYKSVRNLLRR